MRYFLEFLVTLGDAPFYAAWALGMGGISYLAHGTTLGTTAIYTGLVLIWCAIGSLMITATRDFLRDRRGGRR